MSDYQGLPDWWGSCSTTNKNQTRCKVAPYEEFLQNKSSFIGYDDTKIYAFEPCNYASNLAFYHSSVRLCDYPNSSWSLSNGYRREFIRSFSGLAVGSAMWHASHTYVGSAFDN